MAGARPPPAGHDQARPARQAPTATTPQGVQGLALLSVELSGLLIVARYWDRCSEVGVVVSRTSVDEPRRLSEFVLLRRDFGEVVEKSGLRLTLPRLPRGKCAQKTVLSAPPVRP